MARTSRWVALTFLGILTACGPAPNPGEPPGTQRQAPAPSATASAALDPVDPPIKQPFVGAQRVVEGPSLQARVATRSSLGSDVTLSLELPEDWQQQALRVASDVFAKSDPKARERLQLTSVAATHVHDALADVIFLVPNDSDLTGDKPAASRVQLPLKARIWVLTTEENVGRLAPSVFVAFAADPAVPVVKLPVQIASTDPAAVNDGYAQWGRALERFFRSEPATPLRQFALHRLADFQPRGTGSAATGVDLGPAQPPDPAGDLEDLMGLGSGFRSIERALEHRQRLTPRETAWRPQIPIAKLTPPAIRQHDWAVMLSELSNSVQPPAISYAVPADFYLVHAKSGQGLFAVIDELDAFVTPAVHLFESRARRYELAERYQTQLGIQKSLVTRTLGPLVIDELALVGSDPFLRLGSDVTLLFRSRQIALLEQALETSLSKVAERYGTLAHSALLLEGHTVRLSRSKHGDVQRYLARAGDYLVVSNSQAALSKVLGTIDAKSRSLAGQPDFQYMLSRDAHVDSDVFAYAGDAFIQSVVSPHKRILDARRGIAAGELRRVGYAAVLRSLFGASLSADVESLMKADLLAESEARHFDRKLISGDEAGPYSRWGSPRHMTPLIDLDPPTRVTAAEQQAYERFRSGYESAWGDALDPIALRFKLADTGKGFVSRLRVLPLVRDTDYASILELVGTSRLALSKPALGARVVLALAKDSSLRRSGTQMSSMLLGQQLSLDWIGDYAFVGIEDRSATANALFNELAPGPSAESDDWLEEFAQLPVYAGLQLRSAAATRVALRYLKAWSEEKLEATWKERHVHQGRQVYQITFSDTGAALYYALTDDLLLVSTQWQTLNRLLDQGAELGIRTDVAGTAQLGIETEQQPNGALATVLSWLIEASDSDETEGLGWARALSMAVGAARGPERSGEPTAAQVQQMAVALLGEVPVTRDGLAFSYSEIGAQDPARGNELLRRWPALPVPGSEAAAVLSQLRFLRFEVAFDAESAGADGRPQRSLSVQTTLRR